MICWICPKFTHAILVNSWNLIAVACTIQSQNNIRPLSNWQKRSWLQMECTYLHFKMNANQNAIFTRHKYSSPKNLNKSPFTLSPNNVFHSNDSRSHSSRTASVMKVQRSKNSYLSNWFDYHDSSFSGFFGQSLLKSTYYIRTYKEKSSW